MDTSPTSALVTGATGFIGGHLARHLIAKGWRVKLLVRDSSKLSADLRNVADIITGDLTTESALGHAVSDVAVIFHCAANVKTWDTPGAYEAVNVIGTENLLNAIVKYNPALSRWVHISTADVYGFLEQPCNENGQTVISGFGYGDSKLRGEILVKEFCTSRHIPYTILRPTNVIGPGSQFIARIGKELQSGLMLTIDQGRSNAGILYIDTLIDYLVWAAQAPVAVGQCYNVSDGYEVSWGEFIHLFRKNIHGKGLVINLPFSIADKAAIICEFFYRIFFPAKEPLLHRLLVRIFGRTCGHHAEKIRTASGIRNTVNFNEAMQRSIDWFLRTNKG